MLTSISIICPLLNSVAAVVCEGKLAVVILASITALATSIVGMTNSQMKWNNYRTAAEFLKSEYILFQARVEPYDSDLREAVYIKNIEEFIWQMHIKWEKGFQKKNEYEEDIKSDKK